MLSRRALAADHFELNDWQAISVTQHSLTTILLFAFVMTRFDLAECYEPGFEAISASIRLRFAVISETHRPPKRACSSSAIRNQRNASR